MALYRDFEEEEYPGRTNLYTIPPEGDSLATGESSPTLGETVRNSPTSGYVLMANAEQEALDYLKEREALPQQFREGALTQLGGLYGLEGGEGSQQQFIEQTMASPLYQQLMGGQQAGEESIMRQASATGGLRSGNVQSAMYDYNAQLQNQALLQSYNQQLGGLQGIAGMPSYAPQIAQGIAGVGQTLGQGEIANTLKTEQEWAAYQQERADKKQTGINTALGVAGLGIQAYGAGMFSDRRLKKNIKKIGNINGFNWYLFDWNKLAKKIGLTGSTQGCMADEVYYSNPEAVTIKDNFMYVFYDAIRILKPLEV